MGRLFILAFGAATILAGALARPALAADGMDPQRDMIRSEIEAYMKEQKHDFQVYWKEGLNLKSRDGDFKMKIGGRIQLDAWFYADNDDRDTFNENGGGFYAGTEFRRVRIFFEGDVYKYVQFKAQFDFAPIKEDDFSCLQGECEGTFLSDAFQLKDVWIGFHNLDECWGCWFPDIQIGHFKEYFCLEELTSSKTITFMERAMPCEAFAPSRNIGIGLHHTLYGDRFYYGLGWWANTDSFGARVPRFRDEPQHFTGRMVFMPWAPCDCDTRFWTLGGSVSYQFDNPGSFRYRTRPEIHLANRVADVRVDADTALVWGVESAFVFDRFKVQGEYLSASPDARTGDSPTFSGYYVSASYLLGGKGFAYKRSSQSFDKIKPCNDFDCTECGHLGALELAVRYSSIDLTDAGYVGGEANDITVGLNWYLNPNTRIMLNYVYSDVTDLRGREGLDGTISAFGVRFQVFW